MPQLEFTPACTNLSTSDFYTFWRQGVISTLFLLNVLSSLFSEKSLKCTFWNLIEKVLHKTWTVDNYFEKDFTRRNDLHTSCRSVIVTVLLFQIVSDMPATYPTYVVYAQFGIMSKAFQSIWYESVLYKSSSFVKLFFRYYWCSIYLSFDTGPYIEIKRDQISRTDKLRSWALPFNPIALALTVQIGDRLAWAVLRSSTALQHIIFCERLKL